MIFTFKLAHSWNEMWNVESEAERSRSLFSSDLSGPLSFCCLSLTCKFILLTAVFGDCGQATRHYGCKAVVRFDGS